MNKKSCVVIPTHSEKLTDEEQLSLFNTCALLNKHKIFLVMPETVSDRSIREIMAVKGFSIDIIKIDDSWMGSIEKYNNMLMNINFYKLFINYEYILLCHLDAWVFKDELHYWASLDFDWIGAPLFLLRERGNYGLKRLRWPYAMNGGFSLRRTKKMIDLLTATDFRVDLVVVSKFIYFLAINLRFDLLKIFLKYFPEMASNPIEFQKKYNVNEDIFFTLACPAFGHPLVTANPIDALYFATEYFSEEILALHLKCSKPFGIHGYEKYLKGDELKRLSNYAVPRSESFYVDPECSKNPLITIVTITFNLIEAGRESIFRECMQSVKDQSYSNIEHLIVDGNSSDGTLDILREYVDGVRCRLVSEDDEGVWDAMSKGVSHARGEFINFMNSDDYFCDKDAVSKAVKLLTRAKADWFFSGGRVLCADGSSFIFPTRPYGVFNCIGIMHQTMFVRRRLLMEINPFKSKHITRENFLMMVLLLNKIKFSFTDEILVDYRQGGFSDQEYSNREKLKDDFSDYFYNLVGKFWGLSWSECRTFFNCELFEIFGLKKSLNLIMKLKLLPLKIWMLNKLLRYLINNRDFRKIVVSVLCSPYLIFKARK
jgi:glycosyltransferase involved in cell wall biosynthesis